MKIVYSQQPIPESFSKSIFLMVPTPRDEAHASWRPLAITFLAENGYDGVVFVPEFPDFKPEKSINYAEQIEWEERALRASDVIVCWLARDMSCMPGLTTNDEFGYWKYSGKILFGAPPEAQRVSYQRYYAKKLGINESGYLRGLIEQAVVLTKNGSERFGGERFIPLELWNTTSFRSWYQSQCVHGNRLNDARVEMIFRVGMTTRSVFCWVVHVDLYVEAEGRSKRNEIVISRPDIVSVLLYKRSPVLLDSQIVLVKEFRSTVNNPSGFVRELPGGSDRNSGNCEEVACNEVFEETGLVINPERFRQRCRHHFSRQLMATFSAHKSTLLSYEIDDAELDFLKSINGKSQGDRSDDSEQTYVCIEKLGNIIENSNEIIKPTETIACVDWSTLGMILSVLKQ